MSKRCVLQCRPIPALVCCLLLLSLVACSDEDGASESVHLLSGEQISLQSESVVLLNYWAEWCKPCAEEIPELNAFARRSGYRVLGIHFDALKQPLTVAEVQQQRDKLQIKFGVLDPASALWLERQWQLPRPQGLPVTYVIKQRQTVDGRDQGRRHQFYIDAQLLGPQTLASLQSAITEDINNPLTDIEP